MSVQSVAQQSLRKFTLQPTGAVSRNIFTRFGTPVATGSLIRQQKRVASTASHEQLSLDQGHEILVKQRLNRPVSPHLAIYRPQITWYGSALNRITGSALSGVFYVFGFGYLVQPLLGYHIFESSSIIAAFAGMALWAKIPIKFTAAFFFMYHSLNGLRHLSWDAGKMIKNPSVIKTGWAAIGLSTVLSVWLAVM